MVTESRPLVLLFSKGINENVVSNFLKDLARYDVHNVEEYNESVALFSRMTTTKSKVICVCAAEVCYTLMRDILSEASYPKNLMTLILFCGPHEEFYAMWANRYPVIKFISHNLKEVRRAVVWCLSGGDFNLQGDAVQMHPINPSPTINQDGRRVPQENESLSTWKWFTPAKCGQLSSNILNSIIPTEPKESSSALSVDASESLTRLVTLWLCRDIIGAKTTSASQRVCF